MNDPLALARARRALVEAGMDPGVELRRADSVTNEVWLSDEVAVRINRFPDRRLRREAWLAPKLPKDVGYPATIAYGGDHGADWLIAQRRPGTVLSRAWPAMPREERRRAIAQLATLLRTLHDTPTPEGIPPTVAPQLLSPSTFPAVAPLLEGIEALHGRPHVDPGLLREAAALVERNAPAIEPFDAATLIHGDVHFENVLWNGHVITALLDFEFARGAPNDLDLDVLLRFCAFPFLHVAPDYESTTRAVDYAEVPWWLIEDYPELFSAPRLLDRLRLYCVAYDVRDLLAVPMNRPARSCSPHHPHNRLEDVLTGRSHLDVFAGTSTSFQVDAATVLASTGSSEGVASLPAPLAPGALEARASATQGIALPRRASAPAATATAVSSAGGVEPAGERTVEPVGAVTTGTAEAAEAAARASHPPRRDASAPAVAGGLDVDVRDGHLVIERAGTACFTGPVEGGWARQAVAVGERAVVVLDWAEEHLPAGYDRFTPFRNVVCVAADGSTLWRAELPPREKCFVGVEVDGDRLVGIGWSWRCDLDPDTGRSGAPRFAS